INLTHGNIRLFSSPWSAPAWMKTSGKMAGPGEVLPNLKATWANYYVRFFEEYLARGVSFWATTVQNEPLTTYAPFWQWQATNWNATGEANFVANYLGPALAASAAARNVTIISMDDSRLYLREWADVVFSNPVASSYISGVAVHWYFDAVAPAELLSATHFAHPDKFILATEVSANSSS
ncbi:hypothetical protein PMAYCL1PPCAC_16200, partial [Pristionchus mayeri]